MVNDVKESDILLQWVYPQILNPLRYAVVLIQLGHEPLDPVTGHHLLSLITLSEKRQRYPWIGSYILYMYNARGLFHLLSTGFAARCIADFLTEAFKKSAQMKICENMNIRNKELEEVVEECSWNYFQFVLLEISLSRLSASIIIYPFKVIMTRQMADFIAAETKNELFHNAAKCIYRENGIFGFYKGFIPSVIGDVAKCTLYYFFCRILRKVLKPTKNVTVPSRIDRTFELLSRTIIRFIFSNLFYPFEVISTIMMLDNVRLSNGTVLSDFNSWRLCWRTLKLDYQLNRGYSFLFRNHVKSL